MSAAPRDGVLRANLDKLMLKKEDLNRKRFTLQKSIEVLQGSRAEILEQIEQQKLRVAECDERVANLTKARDDLDLTIGSTDEAIRQISSNTELLLAIVDKSNENLKGVF